jgi:xylulose-5-phosphate/fructose-6-phosphate phosphoketolase
VHDLRHGREAAPDRFHVRGYREEGTTTTPFDMVVLNGTSRLHLCLDALRYVPGAAQRYAALGEWCQQALHRHTAHIREHFEDLPEFRDWVWS